MAGLAVVLFLASSLSFSSAQGVATCAVPAPGGEWRSEGHDLAHTRSQPEEETIGPAQARSLRPAWAFSTVAAGGDGDVVVTPIVADGCVYIGTTRGWIYALNADAGQVVWRRQAPSGGGVGGSLAVPGDGRVYVPLSMMTNQTCTPESCVLPYLVALDQQTGEVVWESTIDEQPGTDIYGSPVIFDPSTASGEPTPGAPLGTDSVLIVGISGLAAEGGDGKQRRTLQGGLVLLDPVTGERLTTVWTIHPPLQPDDSATGGTVWVTVAVDPEAGVAYAPTGNPFNSDVEHPHTNAVLKVGVDRTRPDEFGRILGAGKGTPDTYYLPDPVDAGVTCPDAFESAIDRLGYAPFLGECTDMDLDFAGAPNLIRDSTGRLLVGAGQKSGEYHAYDAVTMERVWSTIVGVPSGVGGVVGSTAYDGSAIYGPLTLPGYLWSLDKGQGGLRWIGPIGDALHWGPHVTVANRVVYSVNAAGFLDAFPADSIAPVNAPLLHWPLWTETLPQPAFTVASVSVARNTVYAAVGTSILSRQGFVIAFRP